jgi:hypothetical protein
MLRFPPRTEFEQCKSQYPMTKKTRGKKPSLERANNKMPGDKFAAFTIIQRYDTKCSSLL